MELHEKKITFYKEQDPEKVKEYLKEIENIPPDNIAYVDESGFDSFFYREYAYAFRVQKVYQKFPGRKFQRTNIVAAKLSNRIIAPFQYFGFTDSKIFEFWFEKHWLPSLPLNSVIAKSLEKCKLYNFIYSQINLKA